MRTFDAFLVTLTLNGTTYRFTDNNTNISHGGFTYIAAPTIGIPDLENSGFIEDINRNTVPMKFDKGDFPVIAALIETDILQQTTVRIRRHRQFPTGSPTEVKTLFLGTGVKHSTDKHSVVIEYADSKSLPTIFTIGLTVLRTCTWAFGHPNTCKFDLEAAKQTATIVGVDDTCFSVDPIPTIQHAKHFTDGYVQKGTVQLPILEWSPGQPEVFYTTVEVPEIWLNTQIFLYPGCDKTPLTCAEWGRTESFMGLGTKIPLRNPTTGR